MNKLKTLIKYRSKMNNHEANLKKFFRLNLLMQSIGIIQKIIEENLLFVLTYQQCDKLARYFRTFVKQ